MMAIYLKLNLIKMKKILLPLLAFLCVTEVAKASDKLTFSIGFDIFEGVSKTEALNRKQSIFEKPSIVFNRISTGITYKPFETSDLRLTYKTNGLFNLSETYETVGGLQLTSQIKTNSYIISHPVSKKVMPTFVFSDVTSKTAINGGSKTVKNGFMYGAGVTFLLGNNIAFTPTIFLPSTYFNTKYSYGLSYSYFF
ncbi:hypothetical protein EBU94_02810 [bacterium]|nr:hypothetical protein [bacterium]